MSLELKIDDVALHIESSIGKLKYFITNLAKSEEKHDLKRASLLSYWIDSYTEYIKKEKTFNVEKLPKYHRGDILKINFGYRIGNELGGLHYAIVLDNNNSKKSGVITVIPLVSQKEGFKNSHYKQSLNNGLYHLADKKIKRVTEENRRLLFKAVKNLEMYLSTSDENEKKERLAKESSRKIIKFQKNIDQLNIWQKDIEKLKTGSVVDYGQIITVSKQKIYEPIKTSDLLYGIKISDEDMALIDEKLRLSYFKQK